LSAVSPLSRRIEVGELLPGAGALTIAADIFLPARLRANPAVLFCLPGGALNRGYFDLQGEGDFSFAAHLTARGFIVATLDHLGIGDSSRPRDGFELTPDVLARANAIAMDAMRRELRAGHLTGEPLPRLPSIGVGHSMGAMLTAMQQAHHGGHALLILFGFSTRGLTAALSPEESSFAENPAGARANLVRLARLRSEDPYPEVPRSAQGRELFAGETADRRGVEALQRARSRLLLTAGLFSMIPGSCAPECAAVEVPVFLGLGDRDMAGPPHQIPADYPASPDVTLVVLAATGHAHFLFPARRHLFERVTQWCEAMLPER
jgi:alpha-beta hydrolase superfamily lysophospholipase